jgi:hypothetical protein
MMTFWNGPQVYKYMYSSRQSSVNFQLMPGHNWDTVLHVNKLKEYRMFFDVGLLTCGAVSQLRADIDWKFIDGCLLLYH